MAVGGYPTAVNVNTGALTFSAGTSGALTVDSLTSVGDLSVGGVGKVLFARKTSDQAKSTDATLANDSELVVTVVASATYVFDGFLVYDGATTGDIQVKLVPPASATLVWVPNGPPSSASGTATTLKVPKEGTAADTFGAVGTGAGNILVMAPRGILRTGASAGTLQLQWAQGTSDATATTLYADSWLRATRLA